VKPSGIDSAFSVAKNVTTEPAVSAKPHGRTRSLANVVAFPARKAAKVRQRIIDREAQWTPAGAVLSVILFAVSVSALIRSHEYLPQMWDVFLIITTFSLSALAILPRFQLASLAMSAAAAGYGASILRLEGWGICNEVFGGVFAALMWALAAQHGGLSKWPRRIVTMIAFVCLSIGPLTVALDVRFPASGLVWIFMLLGAGLLLTQRGFSLGLFREPRVALASLAFMPLVTNFVLSLFVPMTYGEFWPTTANLIAALAPLGCVIHAVVSARQRPEDTGHGTRNESAELAHAGHRSGMGLG